MGSIRILLASDLALPRAAMRLMLESIAEFVVVAEVDHSDELDKQLDLVQADVLVISVVAGTRFDSTRIASLVQKYPQIHIVGLSSRDESPFVRLLISAGVLGYVCEQSPPTELFQAIREAAQGKIYIDSQVTKRAGLESLSKVNSDVGVVGPKRPAFLSRRETDVLRLLAQGFTNQQVADNLVLSVKTAETYRVRLMRKLGVKNRAELFRYAYEVGMIDPQQLSSDETIA